VSKEKVNLPRVMAALDRIEKVIKEHPEVRDRTMEFLAGELPAVEASMGTMKQIALWIPDRVLEEAEQMISRLEGSEYGEVLGKVTRSDVCRIALVKGMKVLSKELPAASASRRKAKRKKEGKRSSRKA